MKPAVMPEHTEHEHEHDYHSTTSTDDIESRGTDHHADEENGQASTQLEKQSTAASGYSVFEQRAQSVVSRIRSRDPAQTAKFTHPLTHTKTSPDVIVDFEGPDDPYRPLNWSFGKKAMTTVLYGLTTMGMLDWTLPGLISNCVRGNVKVLLIGVIYCRRDMG
jgi:hypothetical protein